MRHSKLLQLFLLLKVARDLLLRSGGRESAWQPHEHPLLVLLADLMDRDPLWWKSEVEADFRKLVAYFDTDHACHRSRGSQRPEEPLGHRKHTDHLVGC